MVVMVCVTRPLPSIPDYNGRWTQTEIRANRQTELDVDHMLQWPTNWQARLLAHYEMLENWRAGSACVHPLVHGGRSDLSRWAGDEENAELNGY